MQKKGNATNKGKSVVTGIAGINVEKRKADKRKGDYSIKGSVVEQRNPSNVYGLYSEEFSYLKPYNVHFYLECSRKGLNLWKSLLFEEIRRRDLHIGGICQTRKLSVIKKSFSLGWKQESKTGEAKQKEMESVVNMSLDNIDLYQLITDIIEANIQGVTTFEGVWEPMGSRVRLKSLDIIPNHLLVFDDVENRYRYIRADKMDINSLRNKSMEIYKDRIDMAGFVYEDMDPMKILEVHSFDGNAQNGFMNGAIDSLIWGYLFKHFGLKDWSIYVERFASPSIVATRPALMNDEDRRALENAVEKFTNNGKFVVPEGCKFEQLGDNNKSGSSQVFGDYTNYWDRAMAIRVLGQELTTAAGDKGTKALGTVHQLVREDLMIADMMLVKQVMNVVVRRIIDLNYGAVEEYPIWRWDEEDNIDYKVKESSLIQNLHNAGVDVEDLDALTDKFGYKFLRNASPTPDPNQGQGFVEKFIDRVIESVESIE